MTRFGGLFLFVLAFVAAPLFAVPVKVQKGAEGWALTVDGKPFFVKGSGTNVDRGDNGEDYLKMAKDMGANTVRAWGINPRSYYDNAAKLGLMVDAGVWFNAVRGSMPDSYEDPAYREKLKKETLDFVHAYKNHPAILFWNLGNEVFAFTQSEVEKKAFGLFLEDLIQAVHKEDPDHPVVYASSAHVDLKYLKAYVPSVDIAGVNVYGPFNYIFKWLDDNQFDRPVLATEYGPFGAWDRQKDANRLPYDPYDQYKASNYATIWKIIEAAKGRAIGGIAFCLGPQRNQDSLTWYNVNWGEKKREGYWALYTAYTGQQPPNRAPRIRLVKVDRVSDLKPDDTVNVTVTFSDPDNDPVTIRYFITDIFDDPLIVAPPRLYDAHADESAPGVARVRVPAEPGAYRVYAVADDGHGNVSIGHRSIKVKPLSN
jgi:hypothetical protein